VSDFSASFDILKPTDHIIVGESRTWWTSRIGDSTCLPASLKRVVGSSHTLDGGWLADDPVATDVHLLVRRCDVSASIKDHLHRLIDDLDEEQASRLLQIVSDPLERSLMLAPVDDEPLTEDDLAAIAEGEAAFRRGDWTSDDDLVLYVSSG
jgi:hypothetical protein